MRRILVTGGAGFIGANLVRLLLTNRDTRVLVLDDFSTGCRQHLAGMPIDLVEGSILNKDLVKDVVSSCDGIVHLAAQTGVPGSIADPGRDCELNVTGTLNLLEACRRSNSGTGKPRFIFASSNAPLGRQKPPATEDKAPLPISPYGASKLAGEAYCLAYNGSWGLGTVVLRFGNVYGPFSEHKSSVVAKFYKDILSTGRITLHGNGQQTRDFIYVEDLCEAIEAAMRVDVSGEVFQIATGKETSITALAALIQGTAGIHSDVLHEEARQGDIAKNWSIILKARSYLKWEPKVELSRGLALTWEWMSRWHTNAHRDLTGN